MTNNIEHRRTVALEPLTKLSDWINTHEGFTCTTPGTRVSEGPWVVTSNVNYCDFTVCRVGISLYRDNFLGEVDVMHVYGGTLFDNAIQTMDELKAALAGDMTLMLGRIKKLKAIASLKEYQKSCKLLVDLAEIDKRNNTELYQEHLVKVFGDKTIDNTKGWVTTGNVDISIFHEYSEAYHSYLHVLGLYKKLVPLPPDMPADLFKGKEPSTKE